MGVGGSRLRGMTRPTAPNNNLDVQSDPKVRALNAQPQPTTARLSEEVYCTKIGVRRPDEMYIVSAHMDGRGFGEAADDDASGTALIMELARSFSSPDVQTDRSIRFALWNNEEDGHVGSRAYVLERAPLRGKEEPSGSGWYPEPSWLGMVQHDMVLWDRGMSRADGRVSPEQRAEADVNIEFQSTSKLADQAMRLAFFSATPTRNMPPIILLRSVITWRTPILQSSWTWFPLSAFAKMKEECRSGRDGIPITIRRRIRILLIPIRIFALG
jgi:hypothetical protein